MIKTTFSAGDLSTILRVSTPTITSWANSGKIKCKKPDKAMGKYLFTPDDVINNLEYSQRKRSQVISFGNIKGGVGKTTVMIFTALTLSELGFKVLVVDTDKQGNATDFFLKNKPSPHEKTIFNIYRGDSLDEDIIRESKFKRISVIPCNLKFGEIASVQEFVVYYKLKGYLDRYKERYDFILIDTPPDIGLPTESAIISSDYVICVTDADMWGLEGVKNLHNKSMAIKSTNNPDLVFAGYVFNRVFEHRRLDKDLLGYAEIGLKDIRRFRTNILLIQTFKEILNSQETLYQANVDEKYQNVFIKFTMEVLDVVA